mgnify:CR=1 FL=1
MRIAPLLLVLLAVLGYSLTGNVLVPLQQKYGALPVIYRAQAMGVLLVAPFGFDFMGGSMGMYVGNAIIAAATRAVELKRPLILFSAAGGARMQEGIYSLMQMAKTSTVLARLHEAGIPFFSIQR